MPGKRVRTLNRTALRMLKGASEAEIGGGIIAFQDLGNKDYLVECGKKEGDEILAEQGFGVEGMHTRVLSWCTG